MNKYFKFSKYKFYILSIVLFASGFVLTNSLITTELQASPASCASLMTTLSGGLGVESSKILLRLTGRSLDENYSGTTKLTSEQKAALRELSKEVLDRMYILRTKFFVVPTGLSWVGLTLKGRVRFLKRRLQDLGIANEFEDVFVAPEHQLQSIFQTFKSSNQSELDELRARAWAGSLRRSQKNLLRNAVRKVIRKYGALPSNAISVMAQELSLPKDKLAFLENTNEGLSGFVRKARNMLLTVSLIGGFGYGGINYAANQGYISEDIPDQVDSFLGKFEKAASEAASSALQEGRQQINRISLDRDN